MLAIELGADAVGFIFEPSSPRFLSDVPKWISSLPPYVSRVAVFGMAPSAFVSPVFDAIQGSSASFGDGLDDHFRRIAAVRCSEATTLDHVIQEGANADAILLDAHVRDQFGGTGKCIDWTFAASVVNESPKPVILAGGLTAENVAEAIQMVKPYAVDVASGVESSPGIKDAAKMAAFFDACKSSR